MKKSVFLMILGISLIFLLPFVLADSSDIVTFTFEKTTITDVVAQELSIPAKFNFTITNHNLYNDYFLVYSLIDLKITPITPFWVNATETKTIVLGALPLRSLKERGFHLMEYYIKGDRSGYTTDTVMVYVLPLKEILAVVAPTTITRDDSNIKINVTNKENIDFGEAQIILSSDLFSATKTVNISPKSSQEFVLDLNPKTMKTAKAGDYTLKTIFYLNKEYNYTIESKITLQEYSSITTVESSKLKFFGFLKTITKKNDGNVPKLVTTDIVKSRFERSFSTFNIPPTSEKQGLLTTTLSWQRELEPGESLVVEVTTDYTILILILIALIVAVVSLYLTKRPRVIVKKKAIRIQTKGNEFALKIILFAKNIGKEIKEVKLTDRLPHMAKLYERFVVHPDKIELPRLEWNFGTLMPGEERIISYILYSKVMPVGSIELPLAVVHYTDYKERRKLSYSNKLFVTGVPSSA